MEGTVTALFVIGCLVGCLCTAFSGGRWGRLTVAQVGSGVLSLGAILQASSFSVAQLIVGRIVAGLGLGLITSNLPVWQSETATRDKRGMLLAVSLSFLILGQVLAYWLDYAMSAYASSVSWRFPMAFQAFLGICLNVMLLFMPECKWPQPVRSRNVNSDARSSASLAVPERSSPGSHRYPPPATIFEGCRR